MGELAECRGGGGGATMSWLPQEVEGDVKTMSFGGKRILKDGAWRYGWF